jgi:hypothetical protein
MNELRNKKVLIEKELTELIHMIGGGTVETKDGITAVTDKTGFTSYHIVVDSDKSVDTSKVPDPTFTGDVLFPAHNLSVAWNNFPIVIKDVYAGKSTTFRTLDNGSKASVVYDPEAKTLTYTVDPEFINQNAIIAEVDNEIVGHIELNVVKVETSYTQDVVYNALDYARVVDPTYRSQYTYEQGEGSYPWLVINFKNAPTEGQRVLIQFNKPVRLSADIEGVSKDRTYMVTTAKHYQMFEVVKDLGLTVEDSNDLYAIVTNLEKDEEVVDTVAPAIKYQGVAYNQRDWMELVPADYRDDYTYAEGEHTMPWFVAVFEGMDTEKGTKVRMTFNKEVKPVLPEGYTVVKDLCTGKVSIEFIAKHWIMFEVVKDLDLTVESSNGLVAAIEVLPTEEETTEVAEEDTKETTEVAEEDTKENTEVSENTETE